MSFIELSEISLVVDSDGLFLGKNMAFKYNDYLGHYIYIKSKEVKENPSIKTIINIKKIYHIDSAIVNCNNTEIECSLIWFGRFYENYIFVSESKDKIDENLKNISGNL